MPICSRNISDLNKEIDTLKSKILSLEKQNSQSKQTIEIQQKALNSSPNSTMITDETGKILWVNSSFTKLTGYTFEEVLNKNPRILKSGKHSNKFYADLWNTINAGKIWKGEIINKRKNGELYHEEIIISPIFNTTSEITNFIATKQDITNIKKTDSALNESYIKYEELAYIYNQSPAIGFLWSTDKERTVEFVTDNIKQFGYTPEEFYSQELRFSDIIFKDDTDRVLNEISNTIGSGKERLKLTYRIINKDCEIRWVDSHLYVRLGENDTVTHLQGVVLDITEKKKAEEESKYQLEQLMQADKMIALGTLVSGVAHEINNPNNIVILNTPIFENVWNNVEPILDIHLENKGDFSVGKNLKYSKIKRSMPILLNGIYDGSQRIKTIVEDLKSFARKDSAGFNQEVDINTVVKASSNLIFNLISKSTDKFSITYSKDPPIIKGNKQKLEQVIINLIENSCQALTSRKQAVKIEILKNCESVIIKVSDEGKGIKPTLVRKITDPFFTTKRNNGGTGLGLSITSKIITQHNGTLQFESEPQKGTTAIISVPIEKNSVNV